jgi:hypothetical protein
MVSNEHRYEDETGRYLVVGMGLPVFPDTSTISLSSRTDGTASVIVPFTYTSRRPAYIDTFSNFTCCLDFDPLGDEDPKERRRRWWKFIHSLDPTPKPWHIHQRPIHRRWPTRPEATRVNFPSAYKHQRQAMTKEQRRIKKAVRRLFAS